MPLFETIVVGVGAATANAVLKMWLKDYEIASAASGELSKLLIKKIPEYLDRKGVEYTFSHIGDIAGDSIYKLLEKEASELTEKQLEIIVNAAATTLDNTLIDADLLIQQNLDNELLLTYLLSRTGADGGNPALAGRDPDNNVFSESEQLVYSRVLSHASQIIVDIASSLPDFSDKLNATLLHRLDSIALQVVDAMNRVVSERADTFEADYRIACVRKFDRLEIFGADLRDSSKRYNLTVAYIKLMVDQPEDEFSQNSTQPNQICEDDCSEAVLADRALASHQRILIRGPAGSGKTTLLQWFAVHSASRKLQGELKQFNDYVPFLVKLRNYSDEHLPNPENFPKEVSGALAGGAPQDWVRNRLESGSALVLIDGLDEVSEVRREEVRQWLHDLTSVFPNARYVITTRPHAVDDGWSDAQDFAQASIRDMALDDVKTFVWHWHRAVALGETDDEEKERVNALAPSLVLKFENNHALYRLATTPLLCALLCALNRQRISNLPSDRVQLYQACVEMFFRRDVERAVDSSDYPCFSDPQLARMLQSFAWWMIRNGKTIATTEEADQQLGQAYSRLLGNKPGIDNEHEITNLFLHRIAIIRELSSSRIDFPHRTFQEYLGAVAAVEEDDLGLLVNNAHDAHWREVVVLASGLMSPRKSEQLLKQLLERGDSDSLHRHTLYLVAVTALEVVVAKPKDSSEIELEVDSRLAAIVPPTRMPDARELAAAGDLVVPHLKYQATRKAEECSASIRTLALIGTELAHAELGPYLDDNRTTIRRQIITSYKVARNPDAYLGSVSGKIEHLSLAGGSYPETFFQQIMAAGKLKSLNLSRVGGVNIDELGKCKDLIRARIHWSRPLPSTLEPLATCCRLEYLSLRGGQVNDISALASCTSLRELHLDYIYNRVYDIDALSSCSNLEVLSLIGTKMRNIEALVACSNLTTLHIDGTFIDSISALIEAWPKLLNLVLLNSSSRKAQIEEFAAAHPEMNIECDAS